MSAALDRILQSVRQRSFTTNGDLQDDDCDTSLSQGDWKDAINAELHRTKTRIEAVLLKIDLLYGPIGPAVDYVNEIRAIVKDL